MKSFNVIATAVAASTILLAPTAAATPQPEVVPMWDKPGSIHDLNNAKILDPKPVYDDGEVITVRVDGLEKNKKYVAGQCQMEANKTFWFFKLPGCIGDNTVHVVSDSNGTLIFEFAVTDQGANVHGRVPAHTGQKYLTFFPDEEGGTAAKSDAEIVIVEDHGRGFRGSQKADTEQTFRVHHNPDNDSRADTV